MSRCLDQIALGTSLITFVASLPLWFLFDIGNGGMQFVEKTSMD